MIQMIDSQSGVERHGYELTRQYKVQELGRCSVIRVQVKVDARAFQSVAKVELLNEQGLWTALLTVPASHWHMVRKSYTQVRTNDEALDELTAFVAELAQRGQNILIAWAS